MIAVVILLRVLRECRGGGNKLSNVRSFSILRSEEGLTSCNKDNSANFFDWSYYDHRLFLSLQIFPTVDDVRNSLEGYQGMA